MGQPSHSILMHEIAKLLHHAKATNVIFIRTGTSGGIGIAPGTVVVASEAVNNELKAVHRSVVLGQVHEHPTVLDSELVCLG
jgi:uridine phosphorylase